MKTIKVNLKKSLMSISVMLIFSLVNFGQLFAHTDTYLYDRNGESITFSEIVNTSGNTVVVFWESNDPRHMDFLDELESIRAEVSGEKEFNIIAVCTDSHHSNQQITSLAAGNSWDFEVYVDVNRNFARKNGLNNELHTLFFVNGEEVAEMLSDNASADLIVANYILNFNKEENPA